MHITLLGPWEHISRWSYTLMTWSHCWRCSNTSYIYKEDLLRVWTGWGVSIISTNRGSIIHAHHSFRSMRAYIRLELHPYDLEPLLKVLKHFYIYKEDLLWVWTVWGVSIISTNRGSKCESMHNTQHHSWVHASIYQAGATFKWIWRRVLFEKKYY